MSLYQVLAVLLAVLNDAGVPRLLGLGAGATRLQGLLENEMTFLDHAVWSLVFMHREYKKREDFRAYLKRKNYPSWYNCFINATYTR